MNSQRLKKIAGLIKKDMVVADIGTDHAFLPVYLIENRLAKKVYATDNKAGPLKQATASIHKAGLDEMIQTIQTEGLRGLPSDIDVIVIAGMGVDTIIDILQKALPLLKQYQQIIVQPNNNVYLVRQWLSDQGFKITDEIILKDYKYYQIIAFDPNAFQTYSASDIYLGPLLSRDKSPVFMEYYQDKLRKMQQLYQKYPQKPLTAEYRLLLEFFREVS
ncbi:tRNA (adenine(22)-N(1))-methyltransferase [bioreactor metagenome]|uniref:tRNA (Adenine(22)-N(1))-methyltransferase n=1 Tax=bioreactor metagenome TaxID=1076179 RepID=A0A645BGP4_9ZZZZ|nr:class I SAM-dependent methyltransferase [Erysipelotrichaceae bacterium]